MVGKTLGAPRKILSDIDITFPKPLNSRFDLSSVSFSASDKKKNLILPTMLTPALSEEIGMHIGDGFLSDKMLASRKIKYDFRLKGNKDECEYYNNFVRSLFQELYNIEVKLKEYDNTYGFEIYSKALCLFKSNVIGLPVGKKLNLHVPNILKINNLDILTSFVRGLFDTDGNVYFSTRSKVMKDYYPVLSIELRSEQTIKETAEILSMLGFDPAVYCSQDKWGAAWAINLIGVRRLERYCKLIGWNNPKHLNKVVIWKDKHQELAKNLQPKWLVLRNSYKA